MNRQRNQVRRTSARRKGVAAVEMAVVSPILVLFLLGMIDVGQFTNVHQKVVNASREGARVAARNATSDFTTVETAVMKYLADAFPAVSSGTLNSAAAVTLRDADGNSVIKDMSSVSTGSELTVEVTLKFDDIRWISGLTLLDSKTVASTTEMRRE